MDWVRGESLGCGSYATVNFAFRIGAAAHHCETPPAVMAVKSCDAAESDLLDNEKRVLDQLSNSPQIIRCFGDDHTCERGRSLHNLFLEYASGGSLADQLKKSGGRLPELDVKRHAGSVLKGLNHIHEKGFVHCDIKLQNLLVFADGGVKIADFGLAKRTGEEQSKAEIRGTPLFMAPESVNENEYEAPCDIWGLGCVVLEMLTGKPAWNYPSGTNIFFFLVRVVGGDESPAIPNELSEEAKDFLSKCFIKDPAARWTAAMLLQHPFVSGGEENNNNNTADVCSPPEKLSVSPRCPFDFPEWVSPIQSDGSKPSSLGSLFSSCSSISSSPADRIRQLVSDQKQRSWEDSGSWLVVR